MKKLSLIEWFVVFTIILILARPIVWWLWSSEIREKEKEVIESVGLNFGFVQAGVFAVVLIYFIMRGLRDWKTHKAINQKKTKLKLPDE